VAAHREALLDVATAVFIESGYDAASLNTIAQRAGASKTTLYRLFPSKAELFVAVMMRRIQRQLVELDERIREHRGSAEALLESLAVGFLSGSIAAEQSQLRRVIMHEGSRFPDLAKAFWRQTLERTIQSLSAYFASPAAKASLRITNPDEAADVFVSLVVGLTPMLADMQMLPDDVEGWVRTRAHARLRMFLAVYAKSHPGRTGRRSRDL
jgi:AcrR family transcriptional regulator